MRAALAWMVPAVSVVLATVLTRALQAWVEFDTLGLFYAAVVVSAWFGLGPGLLATAAAGLAINYALPMQTGTAIDEVVRLGVFALAAGLISYLSFERRSAEAKLRVQAQALEEGVEARTRALQESEERFRRAVMDAPHPAIIHDEGGRMHLVNQAWTEITGYRAEDIPTTAEWTRRAYGDGHASAKDTIDRLYAIGHRVDEGEFTITTARGDRRTWLFSSSPVGRSAQGLRLVMSAAVDITDRKAAEAAIRESETRFRTIANNAPVMIWTSGPEPVIDFFNDAWLRFTGKPMDQQSENRWQEVIHPDDLPRVRSAFLRAYETRQPFEAEGRVRRHDGEYRWTLGNGAPRSVNGVFQGFIGCVTDISQQRELAEAQLRTAEEARLRAEAEAANRAKEELIAVLSHELRTPLTPVMVSVEMMERNGKLPDEVRSELAMIRRHMELEAQLIDDLLDVTRLRKGKADLQLDTVDAHALLRESHQMVKPELEGRRLDVRLDLRAQRHHVRADGRRLQQVFWNLLKNAIKFTPDDGHIQLRTADEDGRIRVEVVDSGIGIDPDDLDGIFRPFEQARRQTERRFHGLGLGLTICKSLVEMHGGTISATSAGKGKGAVFAVEVQTVEAPAARPAAEQPPQGEQGDRVEPQRILLVEDHASTAALMRRLLSTMGHQVTVAATVREGLASAEAKTFDLVISDLGLPDGTGTELMRQLRERHGLRGIAVSGYGMEADVQRSLDAGFQTHVTKPLKIDRLVDAIRQVTRQAN